MLQFVNHHSLVLAALVVILLLGILLLRSRGNPLSYLGVGLLIAGMFLAWWLLRPSPTDIQDENQVLDQIGSGQAVLLEFQSPY